MSATTPWPAEAHDDEDDDDEHGDAVERRERRARRRRTFGVGLTATFGLVLSVVTIAVFVISGTSVHYTAKGALEEELARRLETLASVSAREVEGDPARSTFTLGLIARLREGRPSVREIFLGIAKKMRDASGARDVVILDRSGRVLISAAADGAGESAASAGQLAADAATIERVVSTRSATSTALVFDRTGGEEGRFYKSAYAPVVIGGEVELLVAVDFPADFTLSIERVDRRFTLLGAGAFAFVLACAVFLVRQRVHVPIYRLVRAMEGGDAEDPGRPVHARVRWRDEIGALTEHYNRMVDRLRGQERELRDLYAQARKKAEFLGGYSKYLVEGVPSAVIAVDPEGRVTVWNEAAQRILGKGGAERIGQPIAQALEPEHPIALALARALKGEVSDEALVALGPAGDAEAGETDQEGAGARLVELAAGPFKNPGTGEILGAAALVHDRTELERLRVSAVRNERLAAVGQLAAGLAHEIRNPLGAISGFAELIERKRGGDDAVRLAGRLRGEVDGLNRFVTEFLLFARDQRIKRGTEDLNELVRQAAETALQAAGFSVDDTRRALDTGRVVRDSGELRVAFEGDPGVASVPVDAVALRAALVNIIKNAVEAMHGTGSLALRVRRSNDRAVIRVRDSGPGIPSELRERIFDPFFTTRDTGVGLGLAIAHKSVVAHGGRILVRAPDEGGTEMVIRLPIVLGPSGEVPSAVEDDLTPREGATPSEVVRAATPPPAPTA